jgi:sortase A
VRRTIAAIGRSLVTLGLLILLFVAYQLWGTGIYTAHAQNRLKSDFKKEQAKYAEQDTVAAPTTATTTPAATTPAATHGTTTTTQPVRTGAPPPTPPEGEVEGLISIPAIGLNMAFVEGTDVPDLRKGPGHYPDTPIPGSLGNAAIAGHRTTYLHPFFDIDKLKVGDEIIIATLDGKIFTYAMYEQIIVKPTDTWVVDNTPDAELTLTSCNPKYSAAERIVTKARLVANKSATPQKPKPRPNAGAGKARPTTLQGNSLAASTDSIPWAVVWGVVVLAVGLAWWWAFRRWRHPATWVIGVVPFLIALFPFYVFLERSIPQGLYSG